MSFKIGDRVKVITTRWDKYGKQSGKKGTVIEFVTNDLNFDCKVELDTNNDRDVKLYSFEDLSYTSKLDKVLS